MTTEKKVIAAAAFGGIAPNLLKIGLILTNGPAPIPGIAYILTYSAGLLIMALLGAATAVLLKENSIKKAFFIGLGLPAFFQVSASNISQVYSEKPPAAVTTTSPSASSGFVSIANADETHRAMPKPKKMNRTLKLDVSGDKTPDSIVFFTKDQKTVQSVAIDPKNSDPIPVPADATSYTVNYQGAASQEMPLDSTTHTNVAVAIQQKPWSGLLQAVGFNKAAPFQIDAEKK